MNSSMQVQVREKNFLSCYLLSEVDVSVLYPHPNQSFLLFLCTHPVISKYFATNYLSAALFWGLPLGCLTAVLAGTVSGKYLCWDLAKP